MIHEDEVFKIGKFTKPHGIKGEIALSFDSDIFDRTDCPYLICKVDGIFVPFFIKEYRFKGADTALITFEDINSEIEAKRFSGLEAYFPRKYVDEDTEQEMLTLDYFISFSIIDAQAGNIGTITDIDDSTINTLFLVHNDKDEEFIIPASDDFITNIDQDEKILYMNLPEGLLNN